MTEFSPKRTWRSSRSTDAETSETPVVDDATQPPPNRSPGEQQQRAAGRGKMVKQDQNIYLFSGLVQSRETTAERQFYDTLNSFKGVYILTGTRQTHVLSSRSCFSLFFSLSLCFCACFRAHAQHRGTSEKEIWWRSFPHRQLFHHHHHHRKQQQQRRTTTWIY